MPQRLCRSLKEQKEAGKDDEEAGLACLATSSFAVLAAKPHGRMARTHFCMCSLALGSTDGSRFDL